MIDNSWYIDKLLIVNNYQTLPFFCFSIKAFFLCFFVICWQDGEISYYNAKDNVSTVQLVLLRFFYSSFPFPFLLLTSIFYPQFLPFVEAFSVPPLPLTQAFFSRAAFSLSSFLLLSQVKRSLPCFLSNWQMRCMSWLRCCFIRKQVFTILPYYPIVCFEFYFFFVSTPHWLFALCSCISHPFFPL